MDSQESSPTPQFKSINSSVLSFLYGPSFTSVHDYWKDHSFDYTDLCWQSDVSTFNMLSRSFIAFFPRTSVLISWLQSPSDLGDQKNEVSHCFHCFPIYLPWSDGTGRHDQPRQRIKKQRHYFANKGRSSQGYGFFQQSGMDCVSWTIKKAERQRIDAFELWCWRRLLRVPRNAMRSN